MVGHDEVLAGVPASVGGEHLVPVVKAVAEVEAGAERAPGAAQHDHLDLLGPRSRARTAASSSSGIGGTIVLSRSGRLQRDPRDRLVGARRAASGRTSRDRDAIAHRRPVSGVQQGRPPRGTSGQLLDPVGEPVERVDGPDRRPPQRLGLPRRGPVRPTASSSARLSLARAAGHAASARRGSRRRRPRRRSRPPRRARWRARQSTDTHQSRATPRTPDQACASSTPPGRGEHRVELRPQALDRAPRRSSPRAVGARAEAVGHAAARRSRSARRRCAAGTRTRAPRRPAAPARTSRSPTTPERGSGSVTIIELLHRQPARGAGPSARRCSPRWPTPPSGRGRSPAGVTALWGAIESTGVCS